MKWWVSQQTYAQLCWHFEFQTHFIIKLEWSICEMLWRQQNEGLGFPFRFVSSPFVYIYIYTYIYIYIYTWWKQLYWKRKGPNFHNGLHSCDKTSSYFDQKYSTKNIKCFNELNIPWKEYKEYLVTGAKMAFSRLLIKIHKDNFQGDQLLFR